MEKGEIVRLNSGREISIIGVLGEGGQGVVYLARYEDSGAECAFKWYFRNLIENPKKFYDHLGKNITNGNPSEKFFIWPEELTPYMEEDSFGYTMQIIPQNYKSFSVFLNADAYFQNTVAMIDAGLNIVLAIKTLHDRGYSYQDFNSGNLFVDPNTGDVLLCDTDNIIAEGEISFIDGTARYIAPEILRDESQPNKNTDRYSLAVVLFMLLCGDHPLEGKKTNVPALTNQYEMKFFAEEPLFIFDSEDNSNAPIPDLHKNAVKMWQYFPSFVKEAFQKSFSSNSLLRGRGRLLESEWIHILMRLKSSLVKCPHCGSEIFLESSNITVCPNCKKHTEAVGYFEFAPRTNVTINVPIFEDVRLYGYHMNNYSTDFFNEIAIVREKPGKFGLENQSNQVWTIQPTEGESFEKSHRHVVVLGENFQIDFGAGNFATVKANN